MESTNDTVEGPPTVYVDREQEEKLVKRLYYQQMQLAEQREQERQAALERAREQRTRRIPKSHEEQLVNRIYDQQLQRFAQTQAEREKQLMEETHKNDRKIDSGDLERHIHRMYDEEREKSRVRRQELEAQLYPEPKPKTISKAELASCVERLYHVDWAKRDEELFQKYVYPHDPKVAKISRSEEESMASRLSTRG